MLFNQDIPLVTVIMSVWNDHRYVNEAIESILNQSLKNFEFIIIDDGSYPPVRETIQHHLSDSRVVLFEQRNLGLTKALNFGLKMARSEFIARMDSDDISESSRLQVQLNFLTENIDFSCVGSDVELISSEGIALGLRKHFHTHDDIRAQLLRGDGGALTHPAVMFKRSIALQIGGFDEEFSTAQDLDFFLRISEVGKVSNIPITLLKWRQHESSVNRRNSMTWPKMKSLAIKKTIDRIGSSQYAYQLFLNENLFNFFENYLSLAQLSINSGRPKSALKLYFKAMMFDAQYLRGVLGILRVLFIFIYAGLKNLMQRGL